MFTPTLGKYDAAKPFSVGYEVMTTPLARVRDCMVAGMIIQQLLTLPSVPVLTTQKMLSNLRYFLLYR